MKNNPVCKENASNVFRKEREQYHEIQDLKAQMQDKNMVINELKKLILGNDLLTGNRGSDLTQFSSKKQTSSTPFLFHGISSPTQACKAKRSSFKVKAVPCSKGGLNLLHMGLVGLFFYDPWMKHRSSLGTFLTMIQSNLQAQVITVSTDRGICILEQGHSMTISMMKAITSIAIPLSFWAEELLPLAILRNRSIIISTHGTTDITSSMTGNLR
ncbi:hypothetical protein Tco_0688676 [Tanacetum coccineum]